MNLRLLRIPCPEFSECVLQSRVREVCTEQVIQRQFPRAQLPRPHWRATGCGMCSNRSNMRMNRN